GGRLDRDTAGIEDDALSDEGYRLFPHLATAPAHDGDPRRAHGALRDAKEGTHAELLQFLLGQDIDLDAEFFELAHLFSEFHRTQHIGRSVDQVAPPLD